MNHNQSFRKSRVFYDTVASGYQTLVRRRQKYCDAIDQHLLRRVVIKEGAQILDVGTGDGIRYSKLQNCWKSRACFYAVEESQSMARLASENLPDTSIFCGKLENLDVDVEFDVIFALWNVIGHVDSADVFFGKINTLLRRDGVFFLDCNNPFNISEYGFSSVAKNVFSIGMKGKSIFRFKIGTEDNESVVKVYSYAFLARLLSQNGLVIYRTVFFNYESGERANRFQGQRLLEIRRIDSGI